MIKNLLFDLDGTISDSQESVIECFRYTVDRMSSHRYSDDEIRNYIGVPIRKILSDLLKTDDEETIEKALRIYREKYSEIGITGSLPFPKIPDTLTRLHKSGLNLFVVTMKNRVDAARIIEFQGFSDLFQGIYGPGLDGIPDNKAELIRKALSEHNLVPGETVMIGDRKEDILSGKENGTKTAGAAWGYGTEFEIFAAAPDYICDSPYELLHFFQAD